MTTASRPDHGAATARTPLSPTALFDRDALRLFAHYYRHRWLRLLGYALAASAQSLFVLPLLLLIRHVFDQAIPNHEVNSLVILGAGIVLIRVLHSLASLGLRAFILVDIKQAVTALRQDLVTRLYGRPSDYFIHTDLDRLHTRIVQDSERFDTLSNCLLSSLLPAQFASAVLLIVLLVLNWWLVVLAVAVLPLLAWSARWTGQRVKQDVYQFQRAFEQFSKGMLFVLRQMDLTRLKACEAQERTRQYTAIEQLSAGGQRMAMSFAVHGQIQRNLTGLAGIIILVAGGGAVAQGTMTLGDLMAFYVAAGLLNGQVNTLVSGIPDLIAGNESLLTLHTLLQNEPTEPYHGIRQVDFDGSVTLHGVTFAYGEHVILRDLDLELASGVSVAIVGPNGAGKSTLLNLLVGFCRPQQGQLRAGGLPYDELDLGALRRSIGVVMQHPSFFAGTVLENLCYGHPEATRTEVQAAARLALADEFIVGLPVGYETAIGEGGGLLSGGERQRLAIARALLGRPRLLILDEPTNHLDAAAIDRLLRGLMKAPQCPTILLISHDPNVIAYAETVYRLDHGRLVRVPPAEPHRRAGTAAATPR